MIIKRYHDISTAHRLMHHDGRCKNLHGHNYRITFEIEGEVGSNGMVVDFGEVKARLCGWLDNHWDHAVLLNEEDPLRFVLVGVTPVFLLPGEPTAENMATYLLDVAASRGLNVVAVEVRETEKCSAIARRSQ